MSEHPGAGAIVAQQAQETSPDLARSRAHYTPARTRARGVGERRLAYLVALVFAPSVVFTLAGERDWLVGLSLVAVGLLLALRSRQRRRSGRDRVQVTGGGLWWRRGARRELQRVLEQWSFIATAAGIPNSRLLRAEADAEMGYVLSVEAPGHLGIDVDLPRLHSALGVAAMFMVLVPDPLRPWAFELREVFEVAEAA